MDARALQDALRAAFETDGLTDDAMAVASAMESGACSILSPDPVPAAGAIARTWTALNDWRSQDPRSGAMVVTHAAQDAATLRGRGVDAVTSFALVGRRAVDDRGLLVLVGSARYARQGLELAMSAPDHVRLVMIDDDPGRRRAA
jgi:hypothetical protein